MADGRPINQATFPDAPDVVISATAGTRLGIINPRESITAGSLYMGEKHRYQLTRRMSFYLIAISKAETDCALLRLTWFQFVIYTYTVTYRQKWSFNQRHRFHLPGICVVSNQLVGEACPLPLSTCVILHTDPAYLPDRFKTSRPPQTAHWGAEYSWGCTTDNKNYNNITVWH